MDKTNLFFWARSELSQDAVICWLLSWADGARADSNPPLHRAGLTFLQALIAPSGKVVIPGDTVVVHKQLDSADIVAEIGSSYVLLIEDKTDSMEHGNQLDRYIETTQSSFPGREILPVFCKTGNQSDYQKAATAGYFLFLRHDFLRTFEKITSTLTNHDIISDFYGSLRFRDAATRSFSEAPIGDWSRSAWEGLFLALQDALPEIGWGYVSNPRGGFMGAWWGFGLWKDWQTYLQIEEAMLVMKMSCRAVDHSSDVRALSRDEWFELLVKASADSRVLITPPTKKGNGITMTAARIGSRNGTGDWRHCDEDGRLDLEATVAFLREAMLVLAKAQGET